MEEVGCKRPISWKWSVEGMFFFHFQKSLVPFGCLELHNELIECANPIIQNCQGRRWTVGERRVLVFGFQLVHLDL